MNKKELERVKNILKQDNMGLVTIKDILIVILNHLITKEKSE